MQSRKGDDAIQCDFGINRPNEAMSSPSPDPSSHNAVTNGNSKHPATTIRLFYFILLQGPDIVSTCTMGNGSYHPLD